MFGTVERIMVMIVCLAFSLFQQVVGVHFHEKTHRKCRQSMSMAVSADWQRACMSKERFLTKTPQVSYVV